MGGALLERRGAHVHLNTQLLSATDGHVVLSNGEEFDSALIVWAAGNASNPTVHNHTDLPVDERGLLVVRPDLRVGTDSEPVPDVWAAGDDAAVPDLASPVPQARTVPNAQHAVRQGRLLAKNIAADLRGEESGTTATAVSEWWRHWGWGRASSSTRALSSRDFPPG